MPRLIMLKKPMVRVESEGQTGSNWLVSGVIPKARATMRSNPPTLRKEDRFWTSPPNRTPT